MSLKEWAKTVARGLYVGPVRILPARCTVCGRAVKFGETVEEVNSNGKVSTAHFFCPD